MTTVGVSDEVWARLDPAAGRLSPATRIKVALWWALGAVVAFVVVAVTASGLFLHRFTVTAGGGGGSDTSCWQAMTIGNSGWFDERVLGETLRPNGTSAVLTRGIAGAEVPSGGTRTVRLHFTGGICRALLMTPALQNGTLTPPDLVLRLERPWGTSTATIPLAPLPDPDGLTVRW